MGRAETKGHRAGPVDEGKLFPCRQHDWGWNKPSHTNHEIHGCRASLLAISLCKDVHVRLAPKRRRQMPRASTLPCKSGKFSGRSDGAQQGPRRLPLQRRVPPVPHATQSQPADPRWVNSGTASRGRIRRSLHLRACADSIASSGDAGQSSQSCGPGHLLVLVPGRVEASEVERPVTLHASDLQRQLRVVRRLTESWSRMPGPCRFGEIPQR